MRITEKKTKNMKKFEDFSKAREAFEKKQLSTNELFIVDEGVYEFLPIWGMDGSGGEYYGIIKTVKQKWWMRDDGFYIVPNIRYSKKDLVAWMPSRKKALRFARKYAARCNMVMSITNGKTGYALVVYPDGELSD